MQQDIDKGGKYFHGAGFFGKLKFCIVKDLPKPSDADEHDICSNALGYRPHLPLRAICPGGGIDQVNARKAEIVALCTDGNSCYKEAFKRHEASEPHFRQESDSRRARLMDSKMD
jgi:hypothetical protein